VANDWQEQQREQQRRYEEQQRQEQQREQQRRYEEQQRQEQAHQQQQRYEEQHAPNTLDGARAQARLDHAQSPTGVADQSGWSSEVKNAYDTERELQRKKSEQERQQSRKPFWKLW